VAEFQEKLSAFDDFTKHFKKLDIKVVKNLEVALEVQIPKLMAQMPTYQARYLEVVVVVVALGEEEKLEQVGAQDNASHPALP
jgi:hypothetical protein